MITAATARAAARALLLLALAGGAAAAQTALPNPLQNAPSSDTPADVFETPHVTNTPDAQARPRRHRSHPLQPANPAAQPPPFREPAPAAAR